MNLKNEKLEEKSLNAVSAFVTCVLVPYLREIFKQALYLVSDYLFNDRRFTETLSITTPRNLQIASLGKLDQLNNCSQSGKKRATVHFI